MSGASRRELITVGQRRAQLAYQCVSQLGKKPSTEFVGFAKKFPALVHACGLVQAVAFAHAKGMTDYLEHLRGVMELPRGTSLANLSRTAPVLEYLRLTRLANDSAGWLKRYIEACYPDISGYK